MFLSSSFDKSVFRKESYNAAIGDDKTNGYAVVRIRPIGKRVGQSQDEVLDVPIVGVYDTESGGLNMSLNAEWKDMGQIAGGIASKVGLGGVAGGLSTTNDVLSVGGISNMGAAWASKKVYQKSSYLDITVPMKIVDWDGTGQPLLSALILSYYMVPAKAKTVTGQISQVMKTVNNYLADSENSFIKNIGEGLNSVQTKAEGVSKDAKTAINGAVNSLKSSDGIMSGSVGYGLGEIVAGADDMNQIRSSPLPVELDIGQYFKHKNMVITGVSFDFSKEMTKAGPLYVKVSLTFSSRMIVSGMDDIGLRPISNKSRFFST